MDTKLTTAVEWFAEYLGITDGTVLAKAKAMEKEQLIRAYDHYEFDTNGNPITGLDYYNKNYEETTRT